MGYLFNSEFHFLGFPQRYIFHAFIVFLTPKIQKIIILRIKKIMKKCFVVSKLVVYLIYQNETKTIDMTTLKAAKRIIEKEMRSNGTMTRIDARMEKHHNKAVELGFINAQEAFNTMGREFLTIANA